MKAVFIERHGGPEELKYGILPDPVAKPGEVVVDIHAASVNGADWKVRAGKSYPQTQFPYVLGRDFSGVVSAVGEGVSDLRVGDAVFAVCDVGQEGAYAEKIAIKAAIVAKKPAEPLARRCGRAGARRPDGAGCVEDTLKLEAGETILIQGGAGGVASFAIQLAKHIGARVITTASAANLPSPPRSTTPSSASATGAWPAVAEAHEPPSRSGGRSWSSSGICCASPMPATATRTDYTRRRTDPNHRTRNHVRQLEALGYTVTLTPAA